VSIDPKLLEPPPNAYWFELQREDDDGWQPIELGGRTWHKVGQAPTPEQLATADVAEQGAAASYRIEWRQQNRNLKKCGYSPTFAVEGPAAALPAAQELPRPEPEPEEADDADDGDDEPHERESTVRVTDAAAARIAELERELAAARARPRSNGNGNGLRKPTPRHGVLVRGELPSEVYTDPDWKHVLLFDHLNASVESRHQAALLMQQQLTAQSFGMVQASITELVKAVRGDKSDSDAKWERLLEERSRVASAEHRAAQAASSVGVADASMQTQLEALRVYFEQKLEAKASGGESDDDDEDDDDEGEIDPRVIKTLEMMFGGLKAAAKAFASNPRAHERWPEIAALLAQFTGVSGAASP